MELVLNTGIVANEYSKNIWKSKIYFILPSEKLFLINNKHVVRLSITIFIMKFSSKQSNTGFRCITSDGEHFQFSFLQRDLKFNCGKCTTNAPLLKILVVRISHWKRFCNSTFSFGLLRSWICKIHKLKFKKKKEEEMKMKNAVKASTRDRIYLGSHNA